MTSARAAFLLDRLRASGPLGFGASTLGNLYREIDDESARAAVDAAWGQGLRYFDTAPYYGFGLSEIRLGDALRLRERDQFILSTKVGRLLVPGEAAPKFGFHSPMPFDPVFDYSYDGVMRSVEGSLARLGLSRIDILYMHDLGRLTHGGDHEHHFTQARTGGFRAMQDLRDQGVVAAIGLGVNETDICRESFDHADLDIVMVAGRYTLLDQDGAAFFHDCRARGIGVAAAGVFNSGVLATGTGGETSHYDYEPAPGDIVQRVAAIERRCAQHGVTLPAAALQFVLKHPAVTTAVIGTGRAARIAQWIALAQQEIPAAFWDALQADGLLDAQGHATVR